jgi:hypothetical protein
MTVQITRRQLLASGGAMVLASFALPKNLRKLLESAPVSPADRRAQAGSMSKIEHVVVLMQENRSFDQASDSRSTRSRLHIVVVGLGQFGTEVLVALPQITRVGAEIGWIAASAFFRGVRTEERW